VRRAIGDDMPTRTHKMGLVTTISRGQTAAAGYPPNHSTEPFKRPGFARARRGRSIARSPGSGSEGVRTLQSA
jgi:hypothetical protein